MSARGVRLHRLRDIDVAIRDVAIRSAGNSFTAAWTTVLRQGSTPESPRVRRKSSDITFRPTENPRRFATVGRTDLLSEDGLAWARLEGNTLTAYILTVGPAGRYSLQSYARTVSGSGMHLKFTRIKGGSETRTVTGRCVKVAK